MMKYLWLVIPLFMIGCSSVKYVTVEHNRLVTQDHKPVNIVGNPPMVCHYTYSGVNLSYSGYFMYRDDDDGSVVLDDFGRGTIRLNGNPICELKLDNSVN